MRKRLLVVGLVMLLASAVSYELVYSTEAHPAALEMVEAASPAVGATQASTLVGTTDMFGVVAMVDSVSDTVVLLTAGVILFAAAAGVRRHAC